MKHIPYAPTPSALLVVALAPVATKSPFIIFPEQPTVGVRLSIVKHSFLQATNGSQSVALGRVTTGFSSAAVVSSCRLCLGHPLDQTTPRLVFLPKRKSFSQTFSRGNSRLAFWLNLCILLIVCGSLNQGIRHHSKKGTVQR